MKRSILTFGLILLTGLIIAQNEFPIAGFGTALKFNGTSDFVNCGNKIQLANKSYTIEFWAKRETVQLLQEQDVLTIFESQQTNKSLVLSFIGNKFNFSLYGNDVSASGVATDTEWHHWAVSFDLFKNEFCLYKDGKLLCRKSTSKGSFKGAGTLLIGKSGYANNYFFNGILDEIRIWYSVRCEKDIRNGISRVNQKNEASLAACWHCDDSGSILSDVTAINNGILHNPDQKRVSNTIKWQVDKNSSLTVDAGYSPKELDLSMLLLDKPKNGEVQYNGSNYAITYNPKSYFYGNDDFSFIINDGSKNDTAYIQLNVNNTGPYAGSGQALKFNGIDEALLSFPLPLYNTDFTVEFWAKRKTPSLTRQTIISTGDGEDLDCKLQIGFTEDNKFIFDLNPTNLTSTESFTDTMWHHFAAVFRTASQSPLQTGQMTLYCDGNMLGVPKDIGENGKLVSNNIQNFFLIGGAWSPQTSISIVDNYFKGFVDEVRVWNVQRTKEQINENMYKPLHGNESGLITCWNFDILNKDVLYDLPSLDRYGCLLDVFNNAASNESNAIMFNINDWNSLKKMRGPEMVKSDAWMSRNLVKNNALLIYPGYCFDNINSSITVEQIPSNGSVQIDMENLLVKYYPKNDFIGSDSFIFKLSDKINSDLYTTKIQVKNATEVNAFIDSFSSEGFRVTFDKKIPGLTPSDFIISKNGLVLESNSFDGGSSYFLKTRLLSDTLYSLNINDGSQFFRIHGNLVLKQAPILIKDSVHNDLFNDIAVKFITNSNWTNNIDKVLIEGFQIAAENYLISSDSIIIKKGVFRKTGYSKIEILSKGYCIADLRQSINTINVNSMFVDAMESNLFENVEIKYQENPDWKSSFEKIEIDGKVIDKENYRIKNDSIIMFSNNFSQPGDYKIAIIANGFDTAFLIQKIKPGIEWDNEIISIYPLDNSINVGSATDLKITFKNAVYLADGYFKVYRYDGFLFEKIRTTSDQVIGNGTNTITVSRSKVFLSNQSYYIEFDQNLFGKGFKGSNDNLSWNFSTGRILSELHYSELIGDKFLIGISRPDNYNSNELKNYPVVFITDGQWCMDQHEKLSQMSKDGEIPDVLAVTIGYPDGYDYETIRVRDLTTGADNFYKFLRDDLVPYIDSNYRTKPEIHTLCGHSFGGLFDMYSLCQYNSTVYNPFKNYIAASPSLWWPGDFNSMFSIENDLANGTDSLPLNLYMTIGSNEGAGMITPYEKMVEVLENRNYERFYFNHYMIKWADHLNTKIPSFREGYIMMLNLPKPYVTFDSLPTVYVTDNPMKLSGGNPQGGIYSGPGVSNGYFSPSVTGKGTFELTYSYTDKNNYTNSRKQVINVIEDPNQSIAETNLKSSLNIYPNPCNGQFFITLNATGINNNYVVVSDLIGKIVFKSKLLNNSNNLKIKVDLSNETKGLYLVKIQIGDETLFEKVVIK